MMFGGWGPQKFWPPSRLPEKIWPLPLLTIKKSAPPPLMTVRKNDPSRSNFTPKIKHALKGCNIYRYLDFKLLEKIVGHANFLRPPPPDEGKKSDTPPPLRTKKIPEGWKNITPPPPPPSTNFKVAWWPWKKVNADHSKKSIKAITRRTFWCGMSTLGP